MSTLMKVVGAILGAVAIGAGVVIYVLPSSPSSEGDHASGDVVANAPESETVHTIEYYIANPELAVYKRNYCFKIDYKSKYNEMSDPRFDDCHNAVRAFGTAYRSIGLNRNEALGMGTGPFK